MGRARSRRRRRRGRPRPRRADRVRRHGSGRTERGRRFDATARRRLPTTEAVIDEARNAGDTGQPVACIPAIAAHPVAAQIAVGIPGRRSSDARVRSCGEPVGEVVGPARHRRRQHRLEQGPAPRRQPASEIVAVGHAAKRRRSVHIGDAD